MFSFRVSNPYPAATKSFTTETDAIFLSRDILFPFISQSDRFVNLTELFLTGPATAKHADIGGF